MKIDILLYICHVLELAPDGEEKDAYVLGVDVPVTEFTGKVIAIIHRLDDVEDKWVVAPEGMTYTQDKILELVKFQEQYFKIEIKMMKFER